MRSIVSEGESPQKRYRVNIIWNKILKLVAMAFVMLVCYSSSAFAAVLDSPYETFKADMNNAEAGGIFYPSQTSLLPLMTRMEYARGRYFQALQTQFLLNSSTNSTTAIAKLKKIHDTVKLVLDTVNIAKDIANVSSWKFQAEYNQAKLILSGSNKFARFIGRYATRDEAIKALGATFWMLKQQQGNAAFQLLYKNFTSPNSTLAYQAVFDVTSKPDPVLSTVLESTSKIVLDFASSYAGEIGFKFAKWGTKVKPPSVFSIVIDTLGIINDLAAADVLATTVTQPQYDRMLALGFLKHYYLGFRGDRQLFDAALGKPAGTTWTLAQSLDAFLKAKSKWGTTFAAQYDSKTNMFSLGFEIRPAKVIVLITTILENNAWLGAVPKSTPPKAFSKTTSPMLVGENYTISLVSDPLLTGYTWNFSANPVVTPTGTTTVATTGLNQFKFNAVGVFNIDFSVNWSKTTSQGVTTTHVSPLLLSFGETAQLLDTQVSVAKPTISLVTVLGAKQLELTLNYPQSPLLSATTGGSGVYPYAPSAASPMQLHFINNNSISNTASSIKRITETPSQVKMIVDLTRNQMQKLYDGMPINLKLKTHFINLPNLYHNDPKAIYLTGSIQTLDQMQPMTITTNNLTDTNTLPSITYRVPDTTSSNFDFFSRTVDLKKGSPFEICFANSLNLTALSAVRVHYYLTTATVYGQQGWISGTVANGCATFTIPSSGHYMFDVLNDAPTAAFPKGQNLSTLADYINIAAIPQAPGSGTTPGSGNGGGGTAPPPASGGVTVVAGVPVVSFTDLPGGIRLFHTPRFSKIDSAGKNLPKSAASWSCVRDNANGRVWEVKTPAGAGGLRDAGYTYTWYNSTGINDGGSPGTPNGGVCADTLNCDTEKYVAVVNVVGLCGYVDWRMPKGDELYSLMDYSKASPSPMIDNGYFLNTKNGVYILAAPWGRFINRVWGTDFNGSGLNQVYFKNQKFYIRLVRGGK